MKTVQFVIRSREGSGELKFAMKHVICAGFTGRDQASVQEHVRELARMGVKPPASIPAAYSVPDSLVTSEDSITVDGKMTSGEVECVVLYEGNRAYVTVGSDHTDREMEKRDILKSKEACPKILAAEVWPYEDVSDHWDRIELKSTVTDGGRESIYQEGTLGDLMKPEDILARVGGKSEGLVLYCGTMPVRGGQLKFAGRFRMEMRDPVLNRAISHEYEIILSPE